AQFGSTERLEQVYQMPLWKIKRDGREEIKKRVLMERIRASKIMDVKVTRAEVEEFYTQYKDSLPEVSQQLELFHIVKFITPSTSTKDGALALAKRVRDSLLAGTDFCQLVKNHSKDPGTVSSCGDLGMYPCNSLVPEFCNAAKRLQPNEVSLPIETPFGIHIIQLIERTKDQVHTRHILIAVPRQDNDVDVAKKYLMNIKEQIEQGKTTFEEAARNYSEEKETQGFGGAIGKAQLSTLDPALKTQLEAMKDGGITEPLQYQADRTKPALHIVYRKRTLPAHKPTIETDYKDLERVAQSFKQNKEYEKWIASLRRELHWEVRQ
ncbi:MAG: peptidylprolyl isomerase, partial [Candidatus Kapabacteria bacterium]|nr:peptidylprolyl isomerase [Candidatus Kapabacteria bacterium]